MENSFFHHPNRGEKKVSEGPTLFSWRSLRVTCHREFSAPYVHCAGRSVSARRMCIVLGPALTAQARAPWARPPWGFYPKPRVVAFGAHHQRRALHQARLCISSCLLQKAPRRLFLRLSPLEARRVGFAACILLRAFVATGPST